MRISAYHRLTALWSASDTAEVLLPYRKSRDIIIRMRIADFKKMAAPLQHFNEETLDSLLDSLEEEDMRELPFLGFHAEGGVAKVQGHEGRHRAEALRLLGETHMLVLLSGNIRWSEQYSEKRFDYFADWPSVLVAEKSNKKIPFPVKREDIRR